MDGNRLSARVLRHWNTLQGTEADVELIEPNGDTVEVRCLLKYHETCISGDKVFIDDLEERFGPKSVWDASTRAVLSAISGNITG